MEHTKGITLVELMVVIVIVAILAAVMLPSMQGRIDEAKWSEANATAGAIRRAVRAYSGETDAATAQTLSGANLSDPAVQEVLGLVASDLEGNYFTAADYTITFVDASAIAVITVQASKPNAPSGVYQLTADGDWVEAGQSEGGQDDGGDSGSGGGAGGGSTGQSRGRDWRQGPGRR